MTLNNLFFAIAVGIVPALLWLWFWLKEDRLHPEPRRLIVLTFLAGVISVGIALPLEQLSNYLFKKTGLISIGNGFLLLLVWALIEEGVKFLAARKTALNKKDFDEPVDALIYMITAALGFAAFENFIFILKVSTDYGLMSGIATGNLRFAGATLVHILSSSIIGASIAFCFFHKEKYHYNLIWGFFFATILHALFNYFIINSKGTDILEIFAPFWALILVLLVIFEKVKKLRGKKTENIIQ